MQAIKIEIKKESIDLNKPYYDEVSIPGFSECVAFDNVAPQNITITSEITRYEVKKVFNNGETKNYLVKIGDENIFNELLEISNHDINQIKDKSYEKGEVYWIRLWLGWLQSSKIKRLIFKKQIESIKNSLEKRI